MDEDSQSLAAAFDGVVEEYSDQAAFWFEGTKWTFEDVRNESRRLMTGLVDWGHAHGETAAIWLPNRPEWFVAHLAFSRIGAPVIPVNTRYKQSELEYLLKDGSVKTLILQPELLTRNFLDILVDLYPSLDRKSPEDLAEDSSVPLDRVIVVGTDTEELPTATLQYGDVVSDEISELDHQVSSTDPCTIFYTSGTTSMPKGAIHTHESVTKHPQQVASWFDISDDDVSLLIMPACGVGGFDLGWSSLMAGAFTVLTPYFDGDTAASLVEEFGVTYVGAIGSMWFQMLDADEDISSIEKGSVTVFSGSARPVVERIDEECDFPVVQPYGLSEAHSHIVVGDPDDPLEQRALVGGKPIHPDIEISIRDAGTGEEVSHGETGEICVKGYSVLREYLNKPKKTAEKRDTEGWFHTDDLGKRDEDGYVYYLGRMEDTLRLRGFRVSPFDIEEDINSHPKVELAQVVGAHRGDEEVPVAFVQRSEGISEEELHQYLRERMADFKVPDTIEFVESFPITEGPNGEKIQRNVLAERATTLVES